MSRGQAACQFLMRELQFYGNMQIQAHLYTDNQAAEHIATQPNMNEHSRSIDIRHHAVRQAYLDNLIDVKGVKTTENPSDITTKYLPAPTHITHAKYLHISFPTVTQQTKTPTEPYTNNGTTISYRTQDGTYAQHRCDHHHHNGRHIAPLHCRSCLRPAIKLYEKIRRLQENVKNNDNNTGIGSSTREKQRLTYSLNLAFLTPT
jgi:hypothetical protein